MFGIDDLAIGGMSLLGGLANNLFAGARQDEQQNFASQQVQQQEAFQERMSSTAYQRATADMKAAGLNPMMMYSSGSSASTPAGGAASTSAAPVSDVMGPAISSALQSAKVKNELALGQLDLQKKAEEVKKTRSETWLTDNTAARTQWEIPLRRAQSQGEQMRLDPERNRQLEAITERPYLNSQLRSILAPTAKAATDVYKLIPPVRLNINSGKRGATVQTDDNAGNSSFMQSNSFDSRFNASLGR